MIAIFTWLYNPNISHLVFRCAFFLFLLLVLVDKALPSLVVINKLGIFWVFEPPADMEGEGDVVVKVVSTERVILSKVVKEGFLISEVKVVDKVVVDQSAILIHPQYV